VVVASKSTSIGEGFSVGSSMILEVYALVDGSGSFFSKHLLQNFSDHTFAHTFACMCTIEKQSASQETVTEGWEEWGWIDEEMVAIIAKTIALSAW